MIGEGCKNRNVPVLCGCVGGGKKKKWTGAPVCVGMAGQDQADSQRVKNGDRVPPPPTPTIQSHLARWIKLFLDVFSAVGVHHGTMVAPVSI